MSENPPASGEEISALFTSKCEFIAGSSSVESLPPASTPEICFIGRSNVGKSSLVNALVGQKALARTSPNPGLTKQLNFFSLGDRLILVDMPGYGYAKVSKERKGEWDKLIRSYLRGRTSLKRSCLLVDARRGLMPHDREFMTLLDETAVIYHVVLTKIDALTAKDLGVLLESMTKEVGSHVAAHPQIIATSSMRKEGIHELQEQFLPFAYT